MGYYRGDYYQGDYYRGDPGGFFSAFGKVLKSVGGAVFKRTPVGAAVDVGKALIKTGGPKQLLPGPPFGGEKLIGVPQAPGGLPPVLVGGGVSGVPLRPEIGALCFRGSRPNKSTYITRGGGTSRWPPGQLLIHPKGTECVKVRRMNVANPRALRRAVRRAMGFKKLAMRVLMLTAPRTKKKFGGFRKRKAA